jgi:hypothetical protein
MLRLLVISIISLLGGIALHAAPSIEERKTFAVLDACIDKLDVSGAADDEFLLKQCPRLLAKFQDASWQIWLPQSWRQSELSVGSLRELRVLLREALVAPTAFEPRLGSTALQRALQQVERVSSDDGNVWQQFRRWLRRFIKRQEQNSPASDETGWFAQLTLRKGYSQAWIEIVTTGAFLLVVILAAFIVFNELRASGILRQRHTSKKSGNDQLSVNKVIENDRINLSTVFTAGGSLHLLLEQLINKLTVAKRLPPARALTTQEILRQVQLGSAELQSFRHLVLAVERSRYSRVASHEPANVSEIIQKATLLLEHLEQLQ